MRTGNKEDAIEDGIQPALTRTCRQIRDETLKMYYELNVFHFICSESQKVELNPINNNISLMHRIEISIFFSEHAACFHLDLSKGLANCRIRAQKETHIVPTTLATRANYLTNKH